MTRHVRLSVALAGIGAAAVAGLALGAAVPQTASDEAVVGAMVRRYILAHPEIIPEALERLRIAPERAAIETPFSGAWAGDEKGDVTLVIFTDYNCPYCRATAPELDRLLAADPRLKIVWREMPVLGPDSEAAAVAALAAARQGKYLPFHRALFGGNHPDKAGIAAAARASALDMTRFNGERSSPDIAQEVASNLALARRLQVQATPFFVIGNRTYEGAIGYDALLKAVAEARKSDG